MPWIDGSTPTPDRSDQELRALVRAKAARIRRRRAVAGSVVGLACVAAVVAGAVALAADDAGDTSALHVTGTGTGSSLPPDTTAPPPTSALALPTTTTRLPTPSTTVRPGSAPTTVRATPTSAAPSTTVSPLTSTSTTILENLPMCTQSEVLVTATPDKAVYAVGEEVRVAIAAENRSGHVCAPLDPNLEFRDAAGRALGGGGIADMFTMGLPGEPRPTWDPGEVLRATFPIPTRCPPNDTACPPGTYSVTVSFGPLRSAPAEFRIA